MNHSLLNEALIEKNIVQIEFYGNEEFSSLGKFCDKYEEATNYYQSYNTNLLLNHITKFRIDTTNIYNKRMQYVKVLSDALAMYRELKADTSEAFGKMPEKTSNAFDGVKIDD